ncbi:MAG: hypothetical protein K8H88_34675 [Sandaracinaceae bacterium]|nr:hypothetical protein [Sandaracinaceae bacterium]
MGQDPGSNRPPRRATASGAQFKRVLGSLLTASVRYPDLKQRIDAMDEQQRYPFDELLAVLTRIHEDLPNGAVSRIGARLYEQSRPLLEQRGIRTPDEVLRDVALAFSAIAEGVPAHDGIVTERHELGRAVVVASAALPLPLVEGYLRAVVTLAGSFVREIGFFPLVREGRRFRRIEITYE